MSFLSGEGTRGFLPLTHIWGEGGGQMSRGKQRKHPHMREIEKKGKQRANAFVGNRHDATLRYKYSVGYVSVTKMAWVLSLTVTVTVRKVLRKRVDACGVFFFSLLVV